MYVILLFTQTKNFKLYPKESKKISLISYMEIYKLKNILASLQYYVEITMTKQFSKSHSLNAISKAPLYVCIYVLFIIYLLYIYMYIYNSNIKNIQIKLKNLINVLDMVYSK